MNKNILICIEYDGSRYSGWQRQGNTDNTIEDKIGACLNRMCNYSQNIEIHGSGRTDMGVHASGQMANFHIETELSCEDMVSYLNEYLPEDIRILWAKQVEDRFHARLSATGKTYSYTVDNGQKANVFYRRYAWHYKDSLNVDKMREASEILIGEHDFRSFSDMKTKKSSVRRISDISIIKENNIITITFKGNGFLYHMVRKLTAALVEAGAGHLSCRDIIDILDKKDRQAFKEVAPAKGLCLSKVDY